MPSTRQFVSVHTKTRRLRIALIAVALVAVFAVPVLRKVVRTGAEAIGIGISRVVYSSGTFVSSIGMALRSKHSLETENMDLKAEVSDLTTRVIESDTLKRENADLEMAMGRDATVRFTLATVLGKPPYSVYDTLIIDGGSAVGIAPGQVVYANGETPIGIIESVLANSAIVELYSAPGQETDAQLSPSNTDITIVGRGGGNFSATVPHDLVVPTGTTVVTKDLNQSVIAVFEKVTSDPRDPFQTLLLAAPVNVNELAFVEVRQP